MMRNTVLDSEASLSSDDMLAQAIKETGLSDFGPPEFMEALNKLIDSTNAESELTPTGKSLVEADIDRILINRLRFHDDLKRHPEILSEDVSDPIIILGMPRTGTTKLQRLLSAAPDVQRLEFWRLLNPAPFPQAHLGQVDPRIAVAEQAIAATNQLMPDWKAIHPVETMDVDEEVYLQVFTCKSIITAASRPIPSYQKWLMGQSLDDTYKYMKQLLQYLQWQDGGKKDRPWILKSPVHMGVVGTMLELFPNASFVFTHRDMEQTVASMCRLLQCTWELYGETVDLIAIGDTVKELFLSELNKHMALRKQLGDRLTILDVQYEDIRRDAFSVIEKIYQHAGRELTTNSYKAMARWEAENPQHSKGKLRYSLDDYGLTLKDIQSFCPEYFSMFGSDK